MGRFDPAATPYDLSNTCFEGEGARRIRADGRTLHVRNATRAEPPQSAIHDALGIDPAPGATRKTIVRITIGVQIWCRTPAPNIVTI